MHISYITTEYPHPNLPPAGGIGSFVKTMAESLVKQGHQVTVFLCFSDEDKEWLDSQIRIVQIRKKSDSKFGVLTNRLYINNRIKKYIKKYNIQLVEAPDWEGIHAFCSFKIPLITRIHGSVTYFNTLENRNTPKIIRFLEKRAFKKSSAVIAVSSFAGKTTKEIFGFSEFDYTTIYNGIDTSKFICSDVQPEKDTILYFGTLIRKKGVLELPYIFEKVIEKLPQAKLILAGKDAIDPIENISTWKLMQELFSERVKDNVSYLGAVPYDKISELIQKSTLCVFPSFAETFGLTTVESMAISKTVITSDFGWNKEILSDGIEGFMGNPKNHAEFADKIVKVLNDAILAKKIGEQARERVINFFDQKKVFDQNINFYNSIINAK